MTIDELERRVWEAVDAAASNYGGAPLPADHPLVLMTDLIAYLREQERKRAASFLPKPDIIFKRCLCAFGVIREDCPEHGHLVVPL